MGLIIARFDLDESVPIKNVPRQPSTVRPVLPSGFPFVYDDAEHVVVEPILLFLAGKYNAPGAYKNGVWAKVNSANAAAADLKDWWSKVSVSGVPWDCADDYLVADWLVDQRTFISGKTHDFLSDQTVKRRTANVGEFYRWALDRGLVERVPEPEAAKRLANLQLTDPALQNRRQNAARGKYDRDPHPISPDIAAVLAAALGPLPSEGKEASSRTRLAFELGYETGMRIDEILNLELAMFDGFEFDKRRPFIMTTFEIQHTKGLVRREVNIPAWLMEEIRIYAAGEREAAIVRARQSWLKGDRTAPTTLLLNHAGAGHNAAKATKASTIQDEFHRACLEHKIVKPKVLAQGTDKRQVVQVPKHTFHDTRHSFAVLLYHSLEERGHQRPWIRVQKALGHAQVSTTIGIYLRVIDHLGSEALERLAETFSDFRNAWRGGAAPAA